MGIRNFIKTKSNTEYGKQSDMRGQPQINK